jgi:type IV pilus assembly protein PilP
MRVHPLLGTCLVLGLAACSDPPIVSSGSLGDGGAPKAPAATTPAPSGAAALDLDGGLPATRISETTVSESEFVETERTRDPFRSYAAKFVEAARGPDQNQRKVTLAEYSIDELKPVAIVMASDYPRAMLVDPDGKGWVVKKGDYIGRPEVIHLGGAGGTDYQVNWRVDRIRDGDIVLLREDPAQPAQAPLTRVIPLRSEADEKRN